jgi:ribonuclease HIII
MIDNELANTYLNIKSILTQNEFNVSEYNAINYGIQFNLSILEWSGVLRVYQNKKHVIRIDYSQLKNSDRVLQIQKLIDGEHHEDNLQSKMITSLEYPIIGTDESGKGDYFGPLVSAGVYIDRNSEIKLLSIGVKDSKLLSDSRILELSPQIMNICKGQFSIIEISPEKYNELYEQFRKEKKNLNTLLAWGHAKAIEEILSMVKCNIAIADQFADEKFIIEKLQEKGRGLTLVQIHKAEQHIAVAAASVLARARFLVKLKKLSDEIGYDLPKGASQSVVTIAQKIVNDRGKETLKKVAKLHFNITAAIKM